MRLSWWLSRKESTCHTGAAGGMGLIPEWGWTPGRGDGDPLQYSCLENPVERGAWWATLHWVAKSQTRLKQLEHTCMHPKIYHFGISIIWKQMRINKYIMKPSQSFPYFTKSRNFWEIRTAINPLSWGSFMLMKRMESQCLLTWTCTNKPYFSSLPHSLPPLEVQNPSSFVLSFHNKFIALC